MGKLLSGASWEGTTVRAVTPIFSSSFFTHSSPEPLRGVYTSFSLDTSLPGRRSSTASTKASRQESSIQRMVPAATAWSKPASFTPWKQSVFSMAERTFFAASGVIWQPSAP